MFSLWKIFLVWMRDDSAIVLVTLTQMAQALVNKVKMHLQLTFALIHFHDLAQIDLFLLLKALLAADLLAKTKFFVGFRRVVFVPVEILKLFQE